MSQIDSCTWGKCSLDSFATSLYKAYKASETGTQHCNGILKSTKITL